MPTFNEVVLSLIKEYPLGGGYTWDKTKNKSGTTRNLVYEKETILKADTATYCSGITFECYFRAAMILGVKFSSPQVLKNMQQDWYCATGKREGPVTALVHRGFGILIDPKDAIPGDFCQLWRSTGSGHSVIITDKITSHVPYWSTQPSTKGIGFRKEMRATPASPVGVTELYIVRATSEIEKT